MTAPRWAIGLAALVAAGCGSTGAAEPARTAPTAAVTTSVTPSTTSVAPLSAAPSTATPMTAPTPTTSPPTTSAPTTTAPPTTTVATRPGADCVLLDDADDGAPWFIVNDGVMGGRSSATGDLTDSVLTLTGEIVTDGGGFSSIRLAVDGDRLAGSTRTVLRLRTDGRDYALTVDDALDGRDRRINHNGPLPVEGGDWEIVEIAHADLRPQLFGTPVDDAPFAPEAATEVGVILSDGIDGPFTLSLDWIAACP